MKINESESELNLNNSAYQSDIDWQKLGLILKKGYPWIGFILFLCLTSAFLTIRYTKPLYESYSEIKLDHENKSTVFGLGEVDNNSFALLSSEMELITSRLFFNKIIESVRLNPQYFNYGQILVDEKYSNPPFRVEYSLKNVTLYNKKIDITVIDSTRFQLTYLHGKEEVSAEYKFNTPIESEDFAFTISLSPRWNLSMGSEFYFVINSHDALVRYLENNLTVEPVNLDANIFRVSFKAYSLSKAHALISAIDTLYYKYSLDEKNRANRNKIEYLNTQLAETEAKLDTYEKYFEEVTITNKTVSLDEDVRLVVQSINGLDSQKVDIKKSIVDLNKLTNEINRGQIVTISANTNDLPNHIISLINELNLLINEREKLSLSYRKNTYTYKTRQKEIDLLKTDLVAQIKDAQLNLSDELRHLENQRLKLNKQLNQLPSKNTEYNKMKRFYSLYEEVYLSLMQSKNEFEIAIAGSTTKIKILSPATMPEHPIKPNQLLIYGISTALFFILSFVFIVISYMAHRKINYLSEVERNTRTTILGAVPRYKSKEKDAKIIVGKHPKSALSESIRSIRTNLDFMLPENETRIYSFTSTIGAEGKTFISTNLAVLLAMAGKKVIILDLDLRKPKVHKAFDHEVDKCGVSTLLIEKHQIEDCIVKSGYDGLDYICAGPTPPNPSELLLRKSFDDLLAQLRKKYDVIILDTPPIGIVTDGLIAMNKADLPIYVLRADYSKLSFTDNINRLSATGRYPNLSLILNSVSQNSSGYGYSYGDVYANSSYYQE
jgi:tyrosine-protein kinase Etk/Wzc